MKMIFSLVDQQGNIVRCNPITTQAYDVIANMMKELQYITERSGGYYRHDHVYWKYSFEE